MAPNNTPSSDDDRAPPGTVFLTENDGSRGNNLVLHPTPTSDPNDPLNWSSARKTINFLPVLAMTALVFTQLTIPTTFWQLWVVDLDCEYTDLTTALALMFVGTSTGCFFFIPFAIKYGRRPVYIVSVAFLAGMAIWSARMNSLLELFASQLIGGLASATNETIAQMTIADLFFVHQRGTVSGLYMAMVMIGNFLGPIIAGAMARTGDWRLCYYTLFGVNSALLVYFICLYEESKYTPHLQGHTHASAHSQEKPGEEEEEDEVTGQGEKAVSQPTMTQETHIDTSLPLLPWSQRLRLITKTDENLLKCAYEPFIMLVKFPAVLYTAVEYSFSLCWITMIISTTSSTFPRPPYNFSPLGVGNMSLGPFIGCILGAVYGGYLGDRLIVCLSRRNNGCYEPEMRLHLLHLPAVCMGGGVLIYGVTLARGLHWIYPSVGGGIFGFGVGTICDITLALVIDSYREVTGEAFVVVAFFRNVTSIGILFALDPWQKAQGLQNMFIVAACLATFIAFFHIPLIKWGKRIRQATSSDYRRMVAKKGNRR
ncbi:hypothetical protein FE257_006017 [Aspergillus nanangensis]|uniref:Major facilitator superfamily (MFS) profile domain-containing protein n=1 Tax=Aspergillus nanangensis TaxID=2582783 RepID=A0AAD4GV33_ASPNN|nr:hypothetical protein FE257_006017 [Aspergillus nanangensis]